MGPSLAWWTTSSIGRRLCTKTTTVEDLVDNPDGPGSHATTMIGRSQPRPSPASHAIDRCCFDKGNSHREPEGWRRQDDHLDQSWRGAGRDWLPRAVCRYGPAGEPHRRPRHLALRRQAIHVRRPRRGPTLDRGD